MMCRLIMFIILNKLPPILLVNGDWTLRAAAIIRTGSTISNKVPITNILPTTTSTGSKASIFPIGVKSPSSLAAFCCLKNADAPSKLDFEGGSMKGNLVGSRKPRLAICNTRLSKGTLWISGVEYSENTK